LALAPETISRLIKTLGQENILTIEGKTVHIHNMDALERACETMV